VHALFELLALIGKSGIVLDGIGHLLAVRPPP
jgi:hypothetical protein